MLRSVEYTPWLNTLQRVCVPCMESRQILAENLKKYRSECGYSQEDLAHRAELDRTYISALERQKYSVTIDRLDEIAKELGVETYVLLMKDLPPEALSGDRA